MNRANFAKLTAMLVVSITLGNAHAIDIVAIGNPAAAALTKEQLANVYLGHNQALTPLDQPESAPIRADYYKRLTGRDPSQIKAMWARLTFTGKGQSPKELPDSNAVKKAVAADPKAIGYIEKSAVDGSVKVLVDID
jgi:ABC-type phosphate transport system substrate-binding protein